MGATAIRGLGMCRQCNTELPPGRHYCHEHYKEALARYQAQLADYEREVAAWEDLSDAEKKLAHDDVEGKKVTSYAGVFGAIAGGVIWLVLWNKRHIDGLYGCMITVGCIGAAIVFPPLRQVLGRFTRMMAMGILYAVVLAAITYVVSQFSAVVTAHAPYFYGGSIALALLGSLFREISGGHHASAAPVKPQPPSP